MGSYSPFNRAVAFRLITKLFIPSFVYGNCFNPHGLCLDNTEYCILWLSVSGFYFYFRVSLIFILNHWLICLWGKVKVCIFLSLLHSSLCFMPNKRDSVKKQWELHSCSHPEDDKWKLRYRAKSANTFSSWLLLYSSTVLKDIEGNAQLCLPSFFLQRASFFHVPL